MSEQQPSGRQRLEALANRGDYVFHGSPTASIEEFVPQAVQSRAEHNGTPIKYGDEKYVFATANIDVAIFAAVVFKRAGSSGWYTNQYEDGRIEFTFHASPEAKAAAEKATGYVYALPRRSFAPGRAISLELVSRKK